jgi:hypothetical protein
LVQMMRSLINLSLTIPSMLRVSLCIRAIDALSFYSYGLSLQEVDLRGTKSMDEVISRIQTFQRKES